MKPKASQTHTHTHTFVVKRNHTEEKKKNKVVAGFEERKKEKRNLDDPKPVYVLVSSDGLRFILECIIPPSGGIMSNAQ
jgi:hypothetical protein